MSEIQYNTETKRGWRIILIDESGTDILYGYAQDKAEKHAKELIRRFNAFEEGGLVDELRTACEESQKVFGFIAENYKSAPHFPNAERLVEAALAKS